MISKFNARCGITSFKPASTDTLLCDKLFALDPTLYGRSRNAQEFSSLLYRKAAFFVNHLCTPLSPSQGRRLHRCAICLQQGRPKLWMNFNSFV